MKDSINYKKGLNAAEVEKSRLQHGANVLTPPRRKSMWRLYLEKYDDPIIRILLIAALVSLGLAFVNGEFIETIGIILAVLFATTIGFYFERDAAHKFDVLTALGEEQKVKVLRDGKVQQIERRDVVVGDIVIIETGDEVPADGTLLEATDLQIDESSLTGEPLTTKHVVPDDDSSDEGTYARNLVLRSSMVMNGRGVLCVTAVGDHTEIGHVARQATELSDVKTPLSLQLDRLAQLISKIGSAVSIIAFAAFLLHDILTQPLWHTNDYVAMAEVVLRYFMMAVTLIVMAVPEGLPMAVTLALALNMRRMLKTNNLVRKLQASETMGAVTVICTDKTGTLTQNRMSVGELFFDPAQTEWLRMGIALNTTAYIDERQQGVGNPTEVALLQWLSTDGTNYQKLRDQHRLVARLPFSTEHKYMASVALVDGDYYLFVKGAPEIVMDLCQTPDDVRATTGKQLLGCQQQAMRTLLLAYKQVEPLTDEPEDWPQLLKGASIVGVAGICDPVRTDVPSAVADCHAAGIEVKMVTGDNELTAINIARQSGILDGTEEGLPTTTTDGLANRSLVITGSEFALLSDEEALNRVATLKVMCRARPADKQRLVELLQLQGEVVAVTGDGTNDAPALNHAHVGLSLGSGTSVAQHASDITIIDDSFRSIVKAVQWGRSLYKNIQRFIYFQLIVNITALLLVLGGSVIGTELPLTVTQILWINLIMDTFAAMALASLPPSGEVMNERPRSATDFIISHSMQKGIVGTGLLFFIFTFIYLYWLEHNMDGSGIDIYELTKFFTVFVMLQWWNLFNARAMDSHQSAFSQLGQSKGFMLVLVMIIVGQWAIVQWGGQMFRTVPLTLEDWLQIIGATSVVMLAGEGMRFVKRWSERKAKTATNATKL